MRKLFCLIIWIMVLTDQGEVPPDQVTYSWQAELGEEVRHTVLDVPGAPFVFITYGSGSITVPNSCIPPEKGRWN